jgi:hypothetical protein
MKRILQTGVFSALIAAMFAAGAFAGSVFNDMNVRETGGQVIVQWTTLDEGGCNGFLVERSTDGVSFQVLNNTQPIPAQGARSYEYTDPYIFKQTARAYTYRVRAVMSGSGRVEYSPVRTIYITLSGIQQTWGGLKALFR